MMHDVAINPSTGDLRQRFSALLEAHRGIVGKVAFAYTRSAHDRDDLMQEIATELWRSFHRYDVSRSFPTWAYRVALNVAISHLRRTTRRSAEPLPSDMTSPTPPEPDPRIGELRRAMEAFPPLDRALLMLYLDEQSYAEIAEVLGITETNVATKIGRLKQTIRRDMTAARPDTSGAHHGTR
jgi:RNA polymerase sigma factor (sigma-70 family)